VDREPDGGAARTPPVDPAAAELWIEILAPVEAASAIIAQAVQNMPTPLMGISIAESERGTILLNQQAWTALHPILKAIEGLQTQHSTEPIGSRAIRFCVLP
jgi:hypothetical protein